MITIQIDDRVTLPHCIKKIKCFLINRDNFLFLSNNGCEIIKWSPADDTITTILLEQQYILICYDNLENCYWAISENEPYIIQQLDQDFCVSGDIQVIDDYPQLPIAIYCDDCRKGIVVNYPCEIAFIDKKDKGVIWYKNEANNPNCVSFLFQCSFQIHCYREYNHQIMRIISCCTEEYLDICIPNEYKFVSITPCCCEKLYSCCFCALYFDTCLSKLVSIQYCVMYCDGSNELHPPHPLPDHSSFYEIIHSIALEEAGISHILNAEGEKIQKAVAISNSIGELICVNESVKHTLTQVTMLEGMLYSKLEAVVNSDVFLNCNKDCNKDCDNSSVEE